MSSRNPLFWIDFARRLLGFLASSFFRKKDSNK